jgi:hypothetical protein
MNALELLEFKGDLFVPRCHRSATRRLWSIAMRFEYCVGWDNAGPNRWVHLLAASALPANGGNLEIQVWTKALSPNIVPLEDRYFLLSILAALILTVFESKFLSCDT